jgi:tRNA threonylcarbamoyladenosine biosynthesis protein TsaE
MKVYISKSQNETIDIGKNYAANLPPGSVIGLKGNLGTGKTQFVKGVAAYFEVNEIVNSPTFLIINEYVSNIGSNSGSNSGLKIFHFDLYRINSPDELSTIGFDEYINDENSISLIEWSEMAEIYLNKRLKTVSFEFGEEENERIIKTE